MTFIIKILISIPISTSSLDASIIIFDATDANMNKLSDFGCVYGNNNNTTTTMNNILLFLSFFAVVIEYEFIIIIDDVIDCGGPATIIEYEFIIIIYDECPDLNDTRRDFKSYVIILVTINSLDLITTITDICNRMKNICDGYGTFNGMISVLNILNTLSTLMLISRAITIVFDEMDLQTDKLSEFECTCGNISSTSISGNNFNTISGTSIVVTHCLSDINLNMRLINGSVSNITILIKFDANNVAMDELVLNLAVQFNNETV